MCFSPKFYFLSWFFLLSFVVAAADEEIPQKINTGHFTALTKKSPFTRTLNLPNSLLLTGVAKIDGKTVAMVADTENGQTFPVSDVANPRGWKLVSISGASDLETLRATISLNGGETVRVTFDEARQQEMVKAAAKERKAKAHDSRKKESHSDQSKRDHMDIRKRFESLTEEQRNRAKEMIRKKYQASPKMTSEQRSQMYKGVLDAVQSGKR